MIEIDTEGFIILVGNNSSENDKLVRESDPEDYWVHISDFSSAHAVVSPMSIGRFPLKQIKQACLIVKQKNNKCKAMRKLKFDITKIKHIESTSIPGQVIVHKILRNIDI
jgi:predicted ribosome quality control (RQC) complex YloA/Tae2 family protein